MKVRGPYKRPDGRKIMSIDDNGKRTTISYPKFLVQEILGIELGNNETIDHIDKDYTNDNLSNLRIVKISEHCSQDNPRDLKKTITINCPLCGNSAKVNRIKAKSNRRIGKAGPFCSRSCAGRYGAGIQHGHFEKFESTTIPDSELIFLEKDVEETVFHIVKRLGLEQKADKFIREMEKRENRIKNSLETSRVNKCLVCGTNIYKKSIRCVKCQNSKTKIDWPDLDIVIRMVEDTNYSQTAKKLGVSDNAVRKFINRSKGIIT